MGCKNRSDPFPGWMSYKATKHGCNFYILYVSFALRYLSIYWYMYVFCLGFNVFSMTIIDWLGPLGRYGDGAGNTVEENSSVFSLIRMR